MLGATEDGSSLAVRAQPGARTTAITGVYGEGPCAQLKIAVQSPPVAGKANAALIIFLAELLAIPKKRAELASGQQSRSKVFLFEGVKVEEVEKRLAEFLPR
jgi:uncharacterized protein (TIGR00251 family)